VLILDFLIHNLFIENYKMSIFISKDKFQEVADKQANKDVVCLGKVPENIIYKVLEITTQNTPFGSKKILKLMNSDEVVYKAWATPRLSEDLDNIPDAKKDRLYLKPLGLKKSARNPSYNYHTYDLVVEE